MTRDEVFARLKALGVLQAVLSFHGGGDEGTVDSIEFHLPDGIHDDLDAGDDKFAEALEEPIFDKYGGFDGEPDISGTLTWDVTTGRVILSGQETTWVPFEEEV